MTNRMRSLVLAGVLAVGGAAAAAAHLSQRHDGFSHSQHRALFPSCEGCHAGVAPVAGAAAGGTPWPSPEVCATCHDGTIQRRTDWVPPAELPHTNLRFTHQRHREEIAAHRPALADSASRCTTCHVQAGEPRMQVRLAAVGNCLACHGVTTAHLEAPDSACATCHVTLPEASRLAAVDVAQFAAPASHRTTGFGGTGHGALATGMRGQAIATSCATCHARDFCATCHANAPEVPAIQALAPDRRSLAIATTLRAPASHAAAEFIRTHGSAARTGSCASCHTQESCATCHSESPPRAVLALHVAGPGRARGAVVVRRRPASHGADFSESHAGIAKASPRTCASCHARAECLTCHRPDAGASAAGYHPAGFLTRHPAAAYARETSCASCHNQSTFCATCPERAGLVARAALRPGYHDAKPGFMLGHGQAARQNLETCTSCHAERDCLTCHSANGGRRFNPHGPGFDAARLRRKNPGMCTACHGQAIPN